MRVGGRSGHSVGVVGQSKWNQRAVLGGGGHLVGAVGRVKVEAKLHLGVP